MEGKPVNTEHYVLLVALYTDMIRAGKPLKMPVLVRGADGRVTPLDDVSRAKVEAAVGCDMDVKGYVLEGTDPEKLDGLRRALEADRREKVRQKAASEEYRPGPGKIKVQIVDDETGEAFDGWLDPAKMENGRVRQEISTPWQLDIGRWTYAVVGHYLDSGRTLEDWERGFMGDVDINANISYWHRLAFAFVTYHNRRGLLLRDDATETQLVRCLNGYTSWGAIDFAEECGSAAEEALVRECMENPDGWEEEKARTSAVIKEKGRWTPPPPAD
jgi:hypothetical protein